MRIQCPAQRPPLLHSLCLLLSVIAQMIWWASPAQSQTFLQQLFGTAPAPQARYVPHPAQRMIPRSTPDPLYLPQQSQRSSDTGSRPRTFSAGEGSGSYTTVCVRMCDGFYFPISHKVQRGRFYRDADVCRSRCGMADARLFYHPSRGPNADMDSAVDLTGRSYADLPIAFLHRKRLVSGCTCRPAPWSEASSSRHERYAAAEGRSTDGRRLGSADDISVVAGNYDQPAAIADADVATQNEAATSTTNGEPEVARSGDLPVPHSIAPKRHSRTAAALPKPTRIAQPLARNATPRAPARPVVASPPPRKSKGTTIASAAKLTWPGDTR